MRTARLFVDNLPETTGELVLSERNHHYLSRVLRVRAGQPLALFNGLGLTATAVVSTVEKRQTTVDIQTTALAEDNRLPVTLALSLIKPDRFDWALQKATELGVSRIVPIISRFTDSPPKSDRLEKKEAHWREIVVNACEQSGHNWLPEIGPVTHFDDLELDGQQAVFAHPGVTSSPLDPTEPCWLIIGPEGGFHLDEVEALMKKQVKPMALGPRILRAETAALVGLTLLAKDYGQLS